MTDTVAADLTLHARWMAATTTGLRGGSTGYDQVTLHWTPDPGADAYEISRATRASGPYQVIASQAQVPPYTDQGLETGTTYFYKVRSLAFNNSTAISNGFSTVASASPIPATPDNFAIAYETPTSILTSWSAVAGADGYVVYRATASDGNYTLVAETTSPSYLNADLEPDTPYYYQIRAYRQVGSDRYYSD